MNMEVNEDSDQENTNPIDEKRSSQQRKLCYRDLLNKVEKLEETEDMGLVTVQEIGGIIKQVNSLEVKCDINERYQHPEETILDSMVLSAASNILVKCIQAVDVNISTYEASEFAKKIKYFTKNDEEFVETDLLNLLDDAKSIIPEVPCYQYVYGAYDLNALPQPKQRKKSERRQRENFTAKEPEKISNVQKEETGIEEIITELHNILSEYYTSNNEMPIKYYDYVIDTESFSNTVENMFYCSFLIRDGKAHLNIDGNGIPYIKPMRKRDLKAYRRDDGANFQIISTITIAKWESYKKEGYIQSYKKRTRK